MPNLKAQTLGRFNYLSFRADLYNVLFVPLYGSTASIIARNLTKDTALALINMLNEAIDEARKEINEYDEDDSD